MPKRVSFTNLGFALDGKKFFPYSGEMHHYRVHPDLWRDRFLKMRAGFLNCTGAYFYWGAIEPKPGEFNFTFFTDLERYFKTAADVGLLIIPRPGGYICAETENGGHPVWLFNTTLMPRTMEQDYMDAIRRYYTNVNRILKQFDIETGTKGKNIFMYQVENEMFSRTVKGGNPQYHLKLRDIVLETFGDSVPIFTNENRVSRGTAVYDTIDHYPNAWDTKNNIPRVRTMMREQPHFPAFGMEIEGGWFSAFGAGEESIGYSYRGHFPAEWTEFFVKQLIGAGMGGLNYYMYHGGTNFGYWGSKYMTTTYDYGAPISEWGGLSPRFYATKLIGGFLKSFGHLLAEMWPNDDFLLPIRSLAGNSDPTQDKLAYVLTRSKDRNAFFFLYNEDKVDHHFPLRLRDPMSEEAKNEPFPIVSVASRTAKIIPYQIALSSQIRIELATLEPYLHCKVSPKQHVLLFQGKPGESYTGWFKLGKERQDLTGTVLADNDQFWRLKTGDEELIIGIIDSSRAERTWLVEIDGMQLPIISNIYLLYDYKKDQSGNLVLEFHQPINAGAKLSFPWLHVPESVDIAGQKVAIVVDSETGVGRLTYCSTIFTELAVNDQCSCGMKAHTVALGDTDWAFREEPLSASNIEGVWQEWPFNTPLESLNFLKAGYRIYRSAFTIPETQKECKKIQLHLPGVIDSAIITINNRFAGYIEQYGTTDITKVVNLSGMNNITIYSECLGHYNHGYNEQSGITGGIYLDFNSGALSEEPNPRMLNLVDWYIKIDPDRSVYDFLPGMPELHPSYVINPEDWDPIKILPQKHQGVGFVTGWQAAFYATTFKIPVDWKDKAISLEFHRLVGMSYIYINGRKVAHYSLRHESSRTKTIETCGFDITDVVRYGEDNKIFIVFYMKEPGDGIWDWVEIRALDMKAGNKWAVSQTLEGESQNWPSKPLSDVDDTWKRVISFEDLPAQVNAPLWVKTTVKVNNPGHFWIPRYLELARLPGKVNVWWNGIFLARYWDIGPQTKFYIPEPLIQARNEVTLLIFPLGKPLEPATAPLVKPFGVFRRMEWTFKLVK